MSDSQQSNQTDQTSSDQSAGNDAQDTSTNDQSGAGGDASTDDQGGQQQQDSKAAGGAPESYAEFKLPEGTPIDKERLDAALPVFKEMNLSQEQAQKLVELQAQGMKTQEEQFNVDKQQRVDAIKADKELGGDNFSKVEETVQKALDGFLNADEQKDLTDHIARFGTSPGLARLLYRVGKGMSESTSFQSGGTQSQKDEQAALKNMYPSMYK